MRWVRAEDGVYDFLLTGFRLADFSSVTVPGAAQPLPRAHVRLPVDT